MSRVASYRAVCPAPLPRQPSLSYLFAASWSRTRPLVLAAASEDSHVYIYDLEQSQTNPVAVLSGAEAAGMHEPAPMYALAFNPKQRDFLATGDGAGCVQIWKLSRRLSNAQPKEHYELEKIAAVEEEGEGD